MLTRIIAYIKFWLRSKNQHGIHSPFVYALVTQCFYDKTRYSQYEYIKRYRKHLLRNKDTIKVTDLGAGSHVLKHEKRRVSRIARTTGSTLSRAKLLVRMVNYFKPNEVLELGTSLGIATYAMSLVDHSPKITTIEGCPNLSKFTQRTLNAFGVSHVKMLNGDFDRVLNDLDTSTFDLIFFDGNHQKEATLRYFETLLPMANNNSVFIFDDIYWSKGMTEAWNIIKDHPKVTVSIDTFFWGIVFFRKEQVKEHFTVRL